MWTKGVCPRRGCNDFTFGTINEPIVVTGIKIEKNDIVVIDQSQAVSLPNKLIKEIFILLKKYLNKKI